MASTRSKPRGESHFIGIASSSRYGSSSGTSYFWLHFLPEIPTFVLNASKKVYLRMKPSKTMGPARVSLPSIRLDPHQARLVDSTGTDPDAVPTGSGRGRAAGGIGLASPNT